MPKPPPPPPRKDPPSPELDAEEQAVMDALLGVMSAIRNDWGMTANASELSAAVHVIQGFVIQHMLHRLAPESWGSWDQRR